MTESTEGVKRDARLALTEDEIVGTTLWNITDAGLALLRSLTKGAGG